MSPLEELLTSREESLPLDSYARSISPGCFQRQFQGAEALICKIESHSGCVNTIHWNQRGTLLISGSDDTKLKIWDTSRRKLVRSWDSGHTANIFCARFMPLTDDSVVVSCAADSQVRVSNLAKQTVRPINCHTDRVKKFVTEPDSPNIVISASEDGTVRCFDLRERQKCRNTRNSSCSHVLVDLRPTRKSSFSRTPNSVSAIMAKRVEFFSLALNPTQPWYFVTAGSDPFVRLWDRRMSGPFSQTVSVFCPSHLRISSRSTSYHYITGVSYDASGRRILASYSGEYIYLFDHLNGFHDELNEASQCTQTSNALNHHVDRASRRRRTTSSKETAKSTRRTALSRPSSCNKAYESGGTSSVAAASAEFDNSTYQLGSGRDVEGKVSRKRPYQSVRNDELEAQDQTSQTTYMGEKLEFCGTKMNRHNESLTDDADAVAPGRNRYELRSRSRRRANSGRNDSEEPVPNPLAGWKETSYAGPSETVSEHDNTSCTGRSNFYSFGNNNNNDVTSVVSLNSEVSSTPAVGMRIYEYVRSVQENRHSTNVSAPLVENSFQTPLDVTVTTTNSEYRYMGQETTSIHSEFAQFDDEEGISVPDAHATICDHTESRNTSIMPHHDALGEEQEEEINTASGYNYSVIMADSNRPSSSTNANVEIIEDGISPIREEIQDERLLQANSNDGSEGSEDEFDEDSV
eukprot:jgi/Galph1/4872/GphlegSOOS_G3562.1